MFFFFFLSESDAYFQRRCHLKFFLPYGPMLAKTKKKKKKKNRKKYKISKNKIGGRVPDPQIWCQST